jgi:GNAT superfamily N-acetyltransferase
MEIVVGYDLEEFKRYYKKLALDKEWRGTFGFTEELDTSWEKVLVENPDLLLVWIDKDRIIGHAIWHETSTDEHREGDPRDREDKEVLRELCGGKKDNIVELHEIWLRKKYRGKGYGKRFFEFFEEFIRKKGYDSIVYYADHPAAIAICQRRGWKEGFLVKKNWHVFCLSFSC